MAKAVAASSAKPTSKKAQGNGKRMPSASSDDSESSSEESDSGEEVSSPVKPTPAPVKKSTALSDDSSGASSSEESSSEEDDDSSEKGKASVKTAPAAVKKAVDSSDESSNSEESSSEGEDDKMSKPVTAPAEAKKAADSSDESSAASSEDSDSEGEDDEMPVATPAEANKKRKAESEAAVTPKKFKLANGNASAATSNEETKSIFVGKLSWNVDNDWLAEEFAECGEVESAHVQMDRNTGRSRGFGYVHFKTTDAVEKALALNGKEIDGRAVNIDKSNPPDKKASAENRAQTFGDTSSPPSAVLFVGNLSFGVDEDALWETFGEHGDVKNVRVPTDRDTGKPKGFAYVEFSDVGSAKKAHGALQGFELDGRSIRLDFSQPRDNTGARGGAQSGRGGRGRGGFGGDRGRGGGGGFGRGGGGFGRGGGGFGRGGGGGGFGRGGGGGFGREGGGGFGRGGGRGGRGGDRGARGRGRGARTGGITQFEGQKITFD